jgi:hypothetical protein
MGKSIRETVVFPLMKDSSVTETGKSKETKIAVAVLNKSANLEKTDIFLLRVVVQHLGVAKFDNLIKKINELKKNQKFYIIVTDTDDRMWVFEPENPALLLALRCANHAQQKYGGERNIACKIPIIAQQNSLSVKKIIANQFSSSTLGNELFDKIVNPLFDDKLDPDFISDTEIIELKEIIKEWQKLPNRFGIGMTLTILIESDDQNAIKN